MVLLIGYTSISQVEAQSKIPIKELSLFGKPFTVHVGDVSISNNHFNINEAESIERKLNLLFLPQTVSSARALQNDLNLCDWMTYQLIRKIVQSHIAKQDNYWGYTFAKFYLLKAFGFEPLLSIGPKSILLYVKSADTVYNVPLKIINNKQYVCLNFHDYEYDSTVTNQNQIYLGPPIEKQQLFSFHIESLPDFSEYNYTQRKLNFEYGGKKQQVEIQINEDVKNLFTNYPVTNYMNQFNIPMSKETKMSLLHSLRGKVGKMDSKKGIDFLMAFSRHAFGFSPDTDVFGREKRFSPEETLIYDKSDCEDRSALFFNLVKEIYNLPMVVLSFDNHVTVAVKLKRNLGKGIEFNGEKFTLCEPTPQAKNLKLGKSIVDPKKNPFEIVYAYSPQSYLYEQVD
jgi:hypothetical protein